MKRLLLMVSLLLPAMAGQTLYNDGTRIQVADGSDQRSPAYTMAGPYVLRWMLFDKPPSKRDEPWWEPTEGDDWESRWLSITVRDAATGQRIVSGVLEGREQFLAVPHGGTHYVVTSSSRHISWTVWAKPGVVRVTERGPQLVPAPAAPSGTPAAPRQERHGGGGGDPAPAPRPSSVPGLPAGVEPSRKAPGGLPAGMQPR